MNNKNKKAVNIKDVFNETGSKCEMENQKIQKLREQLKLIRNDCKVAKI